MPPTDTTMEPFLDMRDATVWRGGTRVIQGMSLRIPVGCSTVILGPNGAGKTTLLELLSRKLHPEEREGGAVRLFGQARWNVWELRARLGVVSHDLQSEYPGHVTALDVVLSGHHASQGVWGRRHTGVERENARRLLETLDVGGMASRPYGTLSTGEQRRVLLGRALVHDPEVLVLDEPTTGLDLKGCFQVLDTVGSLIRGGKTVVLVTHHVHEIPPEIRRAVLLRAGRVVADGPKEEVLTDSLLGATFGTPVTVVEANGFYRAVPPGRSGEDV